MEKMYFETTDQWESWLKQHHDKYEEIWLLFYKKSSNIPCMDYEDAVCTALCYGWIDSIIKSIDPETYVRKFTPRKPQSHWSDLNKKRIRELIGSDRMREPGYQKIDQAKKDGSWDKREKYPEVNLTLSDEFKDALNGQPEALSFFNNLPKTDKKQYILWVNMAKRIETKKRRIQESIELLIQKKKLGLR